MKRKRDDDDEGNPNCLLCKGEGWWNDNGRVEYGEIVHDLVPCPLCNRPTASAEVAQVRQSHDTLENKG